MLRTVCTAKFLAHVDSGIPILKKKEWEGAITALK